MAADRQLVLRLRAEVGSYATDMGKAAKATKGVGDAAQSASRVTTNSLSGMDKAARSTGGSIKALGAGVKSSATGLNSVGKAAATASSDIDSLGRSLSKTSTASGGLKGLASAADQAGKSAGGLQRLSTSVRENREAWDDLSSKAMIGGAAIAGGLGLAAKAAIDWDSAWAGVEKTVDGTPEQMAALEEGLRGLARTLPSTHEEIAGVAEAAGQLGVARDDILGFTETAIALGESTNLSAETAAESLAKFSNIMGTASREGVEGYERLGAALVALGNDGASTEADIMAMALRLAGAGKQIGASEADILAMANALSSVGIEAELGGGAMSRAMLEMNSAVISGSGQLDDFAKTAGMTASEFAAAWRRDPIAATNAFVTGLGKVGESGGDAAAVLQQVGLGGTQNAQVLLRAAGASDLLTDSLKLGASAWKDNAALQEEARKRYETDASKIKIAQNSVKDAAIDLGATLGPALATGAGKIADLANAFVQLPAPVKNTLAGVGGLTAAVTLFGGATVKAVGFAHDFRDRLDEIGMLTPRVEKGLNGAAAGAKALGVTLAAASVGGAAGSWLQGMTSGEYQLESLTSKILDGSNAVDVWNDAIRENASMTGTVEPGIRSFDDAMRVALDPSYINRGADALSGFGKVATFGMADFATATDESKRAFDSMDQSLSTLVSTGNADEAARQFEQFEAHAKEAGYTTEELRTLFPKYAEATAAAGNQSKLTGDDISGMGTDAEAAEEDIEGLAKAIKGLGDTMLQQEASQDAYEASVDKMAESIKENGRTLDATTDAGRANRAALRDLANETQEWAAATLEAGGSTKDVQAILDRGRGKWIANRDALGANKAETRALADELFKIDGLDATARVNANTEQATKKAKDFHDLITGTDRLKGTATVEEQGATEARDKVVDFASSIFGLKGKTVGVSETGATPAKARVLDLQERITNLDGKSVLVTENGAFGAKQRVEQMDGAIFGLKGKTVTVTEVGTTAAGERVVLFKDRIYAVPDNKTANVSANVNGTGNVDALRNSINATTDKTVTLTYRQVTQHFTEVFSAAGNMFEQGRNGLTQSFANGGFASIGAQSPQIRAAGGMGITWAEDGAGPWEAFISGHPSKKRRSRAIAAQTVDRLGGEIVWDPKAGLREAFASGGVYGNWQKELRDVRALSNRYRWEDGSRMIEIFEDGTARWRGYGAAPSNVAREIAQLNAAQDRYEDAKRRQEQPKTKKPFQHSPQYWIDQRRFAENRRKAAEKKAGQRTNHDTKGSASSGTFDRKTWAGDAFKRSDQRSKHLSRTYVAPRSTGPSFSSTSSGPTHVTITDRQFARLEKATERGAYRGAYAGTAQKTRNDLAQTATAPRGRSRGGSL